VLLYMLYCYTCCSLFWPQYLLFTAPKPSCELYTGDVCYARGVIGKDYVFINTIRLGLIIADQAYWENAMLDFKSSLEATVKRESVPQSCVDDILSLLCFHTFPVCDYSNNTSVPRQVWHYVYVIVVSMYGIPVKPVKPAWYTCKTWFKMAII